VNFDARIRAARKERRGQRREEGRGGSAAYSMVVGLGGEGKSRSGGWSLVSGLVSWPSSSIRTVSIEVDAKATVERGCGSLRTPVPSFSCLISSASLGRIASR
jgi:hypothetical protein